MAWAKGAAKVIRWALSSGPAPGVPQAFQYSRGLRQPWGGATGHTLRSPPTGGYVGVRPLVLIGLLLSACLARAADHPRAPFTENRGQWPAQVLYRSLIPGGVLFVERDALTFVLTRGGPLADHGHEGPSEPFRGHAYRVSFVGAHQAHGEGFDTETHYENYFIGNDPAHWGSHCAVFGSVVLHDLYPGIDLRIDGRAGLKYEFIVHPGADPDRIRMRYDGQDALDLRKGRLHVATTAGEVIEEAPVSYLEAAPGAGRTHVDSRYALHGPTLGFVLPPVPGSTLVIDPTFTFGSYTGSSADNFGFTATYDHNGALYGGGIVFDLGYPITLGAFQDTFLGGNIDIGLSKWTPDGTDLIWSTYIGGSGNETPHSLVVNSANELFLLAVTGSADFPTTAGCYDATFNGGAPIAISGGFVNLSGGEGYGFQNGTDIAVAHFAADGGSLIGCTYMGGTGNDGLDQSAALVHNYGDHFRGEIALDAQERPVVASSTQSANAPVTPGAAQPTYGGGDLDAYLFRLNTGLTTLQMATFCGGSGGDSGNGVQLSSTGEIYMTGGTASTDLPMAGSPPNGAYGGGDDGYLMRYAANGALLSSTYIGTNQYDQCFFVQLDTQDDVYVVGQTHGNYPISAGKYANVGATQFIHKFSTDLSTSLWSTVIGSGASGLEDISPSAFLVSNCGQIYFSGWGGVVNHNVLAGASTTLGLPITPDAYQHNTDGSDFYLMVLSPEATNLTYATFFGGPQSLEHVDGGTSRFDKNGNVYQAVCAGCGGHDDFPTTPGAWSNTNNSFNCNLGVFKFNLSQPIASIAIDGPNHVCWPDEAAFVNNSVGGGGYHWTFGDGTSDDSFAPTHAYADTGWFVVTLVLTDTGGCLPSDTAQLSIHVLGPTHATVDSVPPVCPGQTAHLHAHGGQHFQWFPAAGLSDTTIADPIATPAGTTTYSVIVADSCGSDTASVTVVISVPQGGAGPDTVTCSGHPVPISAHGGGSYAWTPTNLLNDPTLASPQATPIDTTVFLVTITTPDGCVLHDSLTVRVDIGLPVPLATDTAICRGSSAVLHVSGGHTYAWQAINGITDTQAADQTVSPDADTYYPVAVSNACGTVPDTAFVGVQEVDAHAWPDTTVCPGDHLTLFASGGLHYAWQPAAGLSAPNAAITTATVGGTVTFTVHVTDDIGCADDAALTVHTFPPTPVDAGPDVTVDYLDPAQLHGSGNGSLLWSPALTLDCDTCSSPVARTETSTTYLLQLTDSNGCKFTDQVTVFVNGSLFVPNTFTPNGDGVNDFFRAYPTEVKEFHLWVFNRWGERIFDATEPDRFWDGTFQGQPSPIDVYVWRVDLTELAGKRRTEFGHVTLLR